MSPSCRSFYFFSLPTALLQHIFQCGVCFALCFPVLQLHTLSFVPLYSRRLALCTECMIGWIGAGSLASSRPECPRHRHCCSADFGLGSSRRPCHCMRPSVDLSSVHFGFPSVSLVCIRPHPPQEGSGQAARGHAPPGDAEPHRGRGAPRVPGEPGSAAENPETGTPQRIPLCPLSDRDWTCVSHALPFLFVHSHVLVPIRQHVRPRVRLSVGLP